jgi:multidrug efflux system membrane fusion protein
LTKVTPGPSDGKLTAILAGLKAGDEVVTDGLDRLSDGATVRAAGALPPARGTAPPAGQGASKAQPQTRPGNAQG